MKIGFVGTGRMGAGMVRNLLRSGNEVAVYNRTRDKAEELSGDGAHVANSPAEACHGAEAVFTMLANDEAVGEVVFGSNGITEGLSKGAAHLSSSTISVGFARRLAEEHAKRGQVFVSATVFGRPQAAENKQLLVIAAGEKSAVDRFRPLFDAIGRKTFVVGVEPWNANALKLCGNFMIASVFEAFGETFATMRKAEMDPHTFLDVMSELFGSPVYKNYGQSIADDKYEPAGFTLKLGLKDVRQAVELGHELGVPMPLGSLLQDQFTSAIAHGQEQLDWSSVALVAARSAGVPSNEPKAAHA